MSIGDLRKEYTRSGLHEAQCSADPLDQFRVWFNEARSAALPEPNAMTVATATSDGRPSARVVLLKDFDARGFVFYSNYMSRKGHELSANPYAALLFYWAELERQVRIEGPISQVPADEADAYFASRPVGSRIGAWASPQSEIIANRDVLTERVDTYTAQYHDDVPRPPHWGGYRVQPAVMEFWQGRPSRLHDRLRYRLADAGVWVIERLAP